MSSHPSFPPLYSTRETPAQALPRWGDERSCPWPTFLGNRTAGRAVAVVVVTVMMTWKVAGLLVISLSPLQVCLP